MGISKGSPPKDPKNYGPTMEPIEAKKYDKYDVKRKNELQDGEFTDDQGCKYIG